MSSWLDRWARRAAEATPTPAQDAVAPSHPASPSTRRDFLKKAGIVGGVAWSVPVLQTVMAPAASASVGLVKGDACTAPNVNGDVCGDGSRCFNGICGLVGAVCTNGTGITQCVSSECSTGQCGGKNASCAGSLVCASGFTCNNAPGNPQCK